MTPSQSIHIIAIGGTGVAPLACLLNREGYQVRGSDGPLYPPMSTLLHNEGLEPLLGFDASHLHPQPDLVIVGNAVPRSNPECEELERRGWPKMSMPEALGHFFLADRDPVVVAGTHGKTTTSTLAAWTYHLCGEDPGYLIGGLPRDLDRSFAKGRGRRFVVEGDEYNAAYFDRGPKFLHYRPQTLILTGVEHDHVDLYPDPESFRAAFRSLVDILPRDGLLIADAEAPGVADLLPHAPCQVITYGLGESCDLHPVASPRADADGTRFRLADEEHGEVELRLTMPGEHNLRNALAVWALARHDGLPTAGIREAFRRFRGAHRRLEVVGEASSITVLDDFAHHPTEIGKTLEALRQVYPNRRLVAVFEPRSLTSGRSFFYDAYLRAFAKADVVHLAPIYWAERLADEERIDLDRLAAAASDAGVPTTAWPSSEELFAGVRKALLPGDVIVTMSSGSFEGLPHRLAELL
jgi:UDP-N-acetylmuramate: L-alanyl-gamma-D-glutamyl-meso-diaminopimelate ligase